jgi:hypothetical protein
VVGCLAVMSSNIITRCHDLTYISRIFLSMCVMLLCGSEDFRWMLQRRFDLETDVRPMGTWPDRVAGCLMGPLAIDSKRGEEYNYRPRFLFPLSCVYTTGSDIYSKANDDPRYVALCFVQKFANCRHDICSALQHARTHDTKTILYPHYVSALS